MTRPTDPHCPFCQIAQGGEEAREIYRDDDLVAFFPLEPATLGHTLIIPRWHVPDVWSADDDLAKALSVLTLRVCYAVRDAMQPDGLNVIQSNGAAATQTVPHLHVHVVPRFEDDTLGRIWPPETNYSESQKDSAWGTLRAAMLR